MVDKEQIAKQCARLFLNQVAAAGVPADVQLMATEMIAKAIFIATVKEERRLEFLDKWVKQIRDGVRAAMKGKTDGKETFNGRSGRIPRSGKASRGRKKSD